MVSLLNGEMDGMILLKVLLKYMAQNIIQHTIETMKAHII